MVHPNGTSAPAGGAEGRSSARSGLGPRGGSRSLGRAILLPFLLFLTFCLPVMASGGFDGLLDADGDGAITIADYYACLRSGTSAGFRNAVALLSVLLDPGEPAADETAFDMSANSWLLPRPNGGSDLEFVHFGLLSRKEVRPGERDIAVPIWLGSREDVEGLRISVWFDPAAIENVRLRIASRLAQRARACGVYGRRLRTGFVGAAVFGPAGPDGPAGSDEQRSSAGLLPSRHSPIAEIVFDVRSDAEDQPAVRIAFAPMPGPSYANELSIGGRLRVPREGPPLAIPIRSVPGRFVRGDVNGDGAIDLGDAVQALAHLFAGAHLACPDAADTDDDGRLLLGDPLRLLLYLFGRGEPPLAPFPRPGEDPTPDALEPCARGDEGASP